jgi:alkanesulfonate monooxygenase SsuD/methylene tetrahydromethanopterin reductase-like flavin-dependent oxidoreductase (luciferase family)
MAESLEVIGKAWSQTTLTHAGKFFQIPEVTVNPKPVQNPLPPFYMATSSLDGVEVAARLGINLFLPIHTRTPEQVLEYATAYWEGLRRHGHDERARELGLLVPMHLAETTAVARSRAEAGVMSYFKTILDLRLDYTDWLTRRGVELPARLRTAAGSLVEFDAVCEKHAVIGDSELALAKLQSLTQLTRAAHLLAWFNIGTVPHAAVKASMEQFTKEVMPKL